MCLIELRRGRLPSIDGHGSWRHILSELTFQHYAKHCCTSRLVARVGQSCPSSVGSLALPFRPLLLDFLSDFQMRNIEGVCDMPQMKQGPQAQTAMGVQLEWA